MAVVFGVLIAVVGKVSSLLGVFFFFRLPLYSSGFFPVFFVFFVLLFSHLFLII